MVFNNSDELPLIQLILLNYYFIFVCSSRLHPSSSYTDRSATTMSIHLVIFLT